MEGDVVAFSAIISLMQVPSTWGVGLDPLLVLSISPLLLFTPGEWGKQLTTMTCSDEALELLEDSPQKVPCSKLGDYWDQNRDLKFGIASSHDWHVFPIMAEWKSCAEPLICPWEEFVTRI